MSDNWFNYGFIGLLVSILAIWFSLFQGPDAKAMKVVSPFKRGEIICGYGLHQQYVTIDKQGNIWFDDNIVSMSELIKSLTILNRELELTAIVIKAPGDVKHGTTVAITDLITKHFNHVPIAWVINKET